MAQSLKRPTLAQVLNWQFWTELTVCGFKPCIGLFADSLEPGACFGFRLPLSLPLPSSYSLSLSSLSAFSLSLSKVNIIFFFNYTESYALSFDFSALVWTFSSDICRITNSITNSLLCYFHSAKHIHFITNFSDFSQFRISPWLFKKSLFIYFERDRDRESTTVKHGQREWEREDSQGGSMLSVESISGLDPMTMMRSWPELI